MKRVYKKFGVLLVGIFLLISCKGVDVDKKVSEVGATEQPDAPENTEAFLADNFVASHYKSNFVWGIAMNFAWNEFGKSVLNEPLRLSTSDKIAKQIEKMFNGFPLSEDVLDKESYYTKAGYGPKTLEAINREVRKKFPQKSFPDLKLELDETDIISYAYFIKAVEYLYAFEEGNFDFMGKSVKGFYAKNDKQRKTISIIKYESDDKFIVSLNLKDKPASDGDCIILAKGYDMKNPRQVLDIIKKQKSTHYKTLEKADRFYAPNIKLNYKRQYKELLGRGLANNGFQGYAITQMFENIKFEMDRKGAKVENEAVIVAERAMPMPRNPRSFILDKPYWVIMKRQASEMPYFLLGVNNSELMEKITK